jgi:hypothetical protein
MNPFDSLKRASGKLQMKRYLLMLLAAISCALPCARADAAPKFTGSWETGQAKDRSFSLDLAQTGNRISGYHTAIALKGRRIDAVLPEDGEPSIKGSVNGIQARVQFRSGYSDATGTATITLQGKMLVWRIISSTPGHFLPDRATLYRQKTKK